MLPPKNAFIDIGEAPTSERVANDKIDVLQAEADRVKASGLSEPLCCDNKIMSKLGFEGRSV